MAEEQEIIERLGKRVEEVLEEKYEIFKVAEKRLRLFRQIREDLFKVCQAIDSGSEKEVAEEIFRRWR